MFSRIVDGRAILVFTKKLKIIQKLLEKKDNVDRDIVEQELGTDVTAPGSVPTAIYSFLRCTAPVSTVEVCLMKLILI